MNQQDSGKSRKGGFLDPKIVKKISETPEELAIRIVDLARKEATAGNQDSTGVPTKDDPMSTAKWELWVKGSFPKVGKIFISVTPRGKGRLSSAAAKALVPWTERDRRLQLLVDRERDTFALQSTAPDNSDSFESHLKGDTLLDLRELFSSLGFALPPKTKRIRGKVGTDPGTGNKIVEFLLTDSFSRMIP